LTGLAIDNGKALLANDQQLCTKCCFAGTLTLKPFLPGCSLFVSIVVADLFADSSFMLRLLQ
jgi:hypothetical protein